MLVFGFNFACFIIESETCVISAYEIFCPDDLLDQAREALKVVREGTFKWELRDGEIMVMEMEGTKKQINSKLHFWRCLNKTILSSGPLLPLR